MSEKRCGDCKFWKDARPRDYSFYGVCECVNNQYQLRKGRLETTVDFGCINYQAVITKQRGLGLQFIENIREVIQEANKASDSMRRAHLAAFGILTMLDGSGESFIGNPRYIVYQHTDDDCFRTPLEFSHHDL